MTRRTFALFDPALLKPAIADAFRKLSPRQQWRNPVMFVVYVGSLLTTLLYGQALTGHGEAPASSILAIALWLWFTVLFANLAEALAEGRSKAQAASLRTLKRQTWAKKLQEPRHGAPWHPIESSELRRGDVVLVLAKDVIPADGEVLEGVASVDESAITGESAPVIRESGGDFSAVTGGTRVLSDWIVVRIGVNPGETFVDRMIAMVESAKRQKTPNEIALTIFLVALTIVFLGVTVTLLPFSHFGVRAAGAGAPVSVTVLIALLVCLIPTTIAGLLSAIGVAGMSRMMQANVIATSGRAIEAAGDVDVLLLDKTGTITLGNRQAAAFLPAPGVKEGDLADAAQLASLADETPEGRSIVVLAKQKFDLRGRDVHALGAHFLHFSAQTRMSGVNLPLEVRTAEVVGADVTPPAMRAIRKGAADAVRRHVESLGGAFPVALARTIEDVSRRGGTPLAVSDGTRVLGIIELKDIVKGGIKERFAELRRMGIKTVMVTGDNRLTAAAIAAEAGVDDFLAEATPEDKLALIRQHQAEGRLVAMTGDGTVPDRVFDQADEVVIVDLPPDDLLQRLKEGKVYLPQQAATAVRNFFRKGNLIALRELALRRTADRVDDEMLHYRRTQSVAPVWQTREALLLAVGPDERSEKLVRATARMASQLAVPWHCVYVETPRLQRLSDATRQRILHVLKLAQDAGADTATLAGGSLAAAIVRYAQEHNLSRVVLGRDTTRWRRWWRSSLAEAVGRDGPDLDVVQIALPARDAARRWSRHPPEGEQALSSPGWLPYLWSALICAGATFVTAPLHAVLDPANIVMVFLIAVVAVAMRYGRGPAVMAAFLTVAAFDFFYVPPRFTFSVHDAQYLLTFAVMLVVALVIGQLTAGLKFQAHVATLREERVRALYEMSRDLSGALLAEQIAEIAGRFLQSEFEARAALLVADLQGKVGVPVAAPEPPGGVDVGVAQWAFDHDEAAGHGTNTLPASPILYLPLRAPMRMRGVLAIEPRQPARLAGPEQRRVLDTCASLLAISLERIHYVDVAQSTTVQMESERLRNSLLSAISHDLRTPLAALVGMADTLGMNPPPAPERQAEIARSMREAALRMNSQVNNLLDMARLQSGHVHLDLQWLPLEEAVGSALRAMAGTIDVRRVRVGLPSDLPLVQVDAELFERVLCNLLENAAKYTPPGTAIEIGAEVVGDRVRIHMDDLGPGLPRHREEAIFEMFERGRKESATPGVGLGLAICRAIVQAHGGTIRGQTRAGGGARFTIELPRREPPVVVPQEAEPAGAAS